MSGATVRETIIVKDTNGTYKVLYVTYTGEYFMASHIVGTVQPITSTEAYNLKSNTGE